LDESNKIVLNELLIRKIVRAVEKGIGEDIRDYLRDNRKETNNALRQMPGDNINENLRQMVVSDGIELIPFTRGIGWDGRILIDRINKRTYTITTKQTLYSIPRKKGRQMPHFLQSVLYCENGACIAQNKQMSLVDYGIVTFDSSELAIDYEKVMGGHISREDNYRHYIVVYETHRGEITDIKLKFLDKDFDIIDECPLNDYIKLDFAKLTATRPVEKNETESSKRVHNLVKVKKDIQIPTIDEEQEDNNAGKEGFKPLIRKGENNKQA